jgi:hypothetical protein
VSSELCRTSAPMSSKPPPYPSVGILMWTGENREDVVQDLSPAIHQAIRTFSACKPFGPFTTSNSTAWPS